MEELDFRLHHNFFEVMKKDFFGGGEKKGEGKGGIYFKRENIFMLRKRITEKEREENIKEKECICGGEEKWKKENEEYIWRRKIYYFWEEKKN